MRYFPKPSSGGTSALSFCTTAAQNAQCVSDEDKEKVCSVFDIPCAGTNRWYYRGSWTTGWGVKGSATYSYLYQEYNIPEKLWCNYPRPCKGIVNAINYLWGNYYWGWGFSWNYYSGWNTFLSCGVSNNIFSWQGSSTVPSIGYGVLDTTLCSEIGEEDCVYPRLKNCLRSFCVSPSVSNACNDKRGKFDETECCKSTGCSSPEECKIVASKISQTYEIEYELVKPGYSCVEEIPTLPETSAFSSINLYADTCRQCTYGCSPDVECRRPDDTTECYCCEAKEPSTTQSWTEIVRWDTHKIIRWELKDNCEDLSCFNYYNYWGYWGYGYGNVCAKCDDNSCLRNYDYWYYGYNYINNAHAYIGSDCCNTNWWGDPWSGGWGYNYYDGNYLNWWNLWYSGFVFYNVSSCPDDSIGPNQNYYCRPTEGGSSYCQILDNDSDSANGLRAYSSEAYCERFCGEYDEWVSGINQCFASKPAYRTCLACDDTCVDQYRDDECLESGPGYKTEQTYVVSPPDPKCFSGTGDSPQEYRYYTDYVTFKPKIRQVEAVEQLSHWKAWEFSHDTSDPNAYRCSSTLPCGDFDSCMEPVIACSYPEPLSNPLVTYSITYNPPEVVETVTAELTVYFCKLLYTDCT